MESSSNPYDSYPGYDAPGPDPIDAAETLGTGFGVYDGLAGTTLGESSGSSGGDMAGSAETLGMGAASHSVYADTIGAGTVSSTGPTHSSLVDDGEAMMVPGGEDEDALLLLNNVEATIFDPNLTNLDNLGDDLGPSLDSFSQLQQLPQLSFQGGVSVFPGDGASPSSHVPEGIETRQCNFQGSDSVILPARFVNVQDQQETTLQVRSL